MELTRSEMLKMGLLGSAALALPLERTARTKSEDPSGRLPRPSVAELPIPKPLLPTSRTADTDHYTITMRPGTAGVIPGFSTPIWCYNGQFPGPMIDSRSKRKVVVDFVNRLPVDTSIHNHGAYVDGDSDGHPEDKTRPGESKRYVYPNDETSRFQWYHDHTAHTTAVNVATKNYKYRKQRSRFVPDLREAKIASLDDVQGATAGDHICRED